MKKGIIYLALILFISALAGSCTSRKAQCGAYAKQDVELMVKEKSI